MALFDLPSGEPTGVVGAIPIQNDYVTVLAPMDGPLNDMAASPDGTHILVGAMLWRIDPDFVQSNILSIQQPGIRVDDAFSPDGTEYVVSGDR